MEEKLKYIYDDIYRWLVFAEAKNAALLTFLAFFLEQLFANGNEEWIFGRFFFYTMCLLVIVTMLILLSSFVPFLNNRKWAGSLAYHTYKKLKSDNSIFYTNLFLMDYDKQINKDSETLSVEELLGGLANGNESSLGKMEKDLIKQIKVILSISLYTFSSRNL